MPWSGSSLDAAARGWGLTRLPDEDDVYFSNRISRFVRNDRSAFNLALRSTIKAGKIRIVSYSLEGIRGFNKL